MKEVSCSVSRLKQSNRGFMLSSLRAANKLMDLQKRHAKKEEESKKASYTALLEDRMARRRPENGYTLSPTDITLDPGGW
jgi:hypothetical protein